MPIDKVLLKRYKVIEAIGGGAFGNTYLAIDTAFPGEPHRVVKHLCPQNDEPENVEIAKRLFKTEAECLAKLGEHDQIPRLFSYFEEDGEFYLERGNQLWRLSRYSEAVEAFDRAIAIEPEFIHLAYYGKGLALGYEGKYEAALAILSLATEAEPNFAPAFLYKSSVLQKLNRLEEALVAIEQAISLQNNNANL
jgi:tetratricopeptide (TPR) repeat protein